MISQHGQTLHVGIRLNRVLHLPWPILGCLHLRSQKSHCEALAGVAGWFQPPQPLRSRPGTSLERFEPVAGTLPTALRQKRHQQQIELSILLLPPETIPDLCGMVIGTREQNQLNRAPVEIQ